MRLRKLCELCNVDYNIKNPKRSLNKIKKQYIIEEYKPHNYNIIGIQPSKMNVSKFENQFQIPQKYIHKAGVYKIELNNDIYVGQTIDFYKRFIHHHYGNSFNNTTTKEMLDNGAIMTILELENDKDRRIEKESKWSYYFLEQGYNVKNRFKKFNNNNNKYIKIKIKESQYDKVKQLLLDNNINFIIK